MADPVDARIVSAWANSADLCEAAFEANELRFRREPNAFIALDPPPPYYSNLTFLAVPGETDPLAAVRDLAQRTAGPCSV